MGSTSLSRKTMDVIKFLLFFLVSLDEAESTSFSVELGDLIVLATDGLFDNVSTEQILNELSQLEVSKMQIGWALKVMYRTCSMSQIACG